MTGIFTTIMIAAACFLLPCLVFAALVLGWFKGAKFAFKQFEPPELMPSPPTAEELRESISKIQCPFDIVFDTLITTQFAAGGYAYGWDKIYSDIVNHATAYAKDLGPNVKIIVVRAIKVTSSGKPEFSFEPIMMLPKS